MKIYSTSLFRVYYKDSTGIWNYLISETPFSFGTIEGLLCLNYPERVQLLEILERSNGIQAVKLDKKEYGFEYVGESNIDENKYRLLNARFEDISTIDEIKRKTEDEKHEERKRRFKENMIKSGKWKENV